MNIAIAGYGVEGEASYRYWKSKGANVKIYDEKQPTVGLPENVETYISSDAFTKINNVDLIIRTAGLNPNKIHSDSKIWTATNEFFENCPAAIIGVTGTKGKGTTCTLIFEILKATGRKVHLVGNIGTAALDVLTDISPTDLVVFELSSFQLWDAVKSPETAVVLMIEPDHMDVHASLTEYVEAKTNIARYQSLTDLIVYHPTNPYSAQIAETSQAQKRRYMSPEGAQLRDGNISIEENIICSESEIGLLGPHNKENICAAITAVWNYTQDIDSIRTAIQRFKGLPHRLEYVNEVKGVSYINDSFSSAPPATSAAIKSFDKPEILICGGFDRGLDYTQLAQSINEQQNIKKVLLIGQTKNKIAGCLNIEGFSKYEVLETTDMDEIISHAQNVAVPGDVVIFSPGCASFDMFDNFSDRGDQFKKIVGSL